MDKFERQKKKLNKKGYPEIYKNLTQKIFDLTNKDLFEFPIENQYGKDLYNSIEFYDVKYKSSYEGDNSVVDFKVKECPDWKFRVCWEPKTNENKKDKRLFVEGKFFCCYEPLEDKFNYYNSNIKCKLGGCQVEKGNLKDWAIYPDDVRGIIEFIIKEPYLAFCREYCGWDYNKQYHDRRSAQNKFKKWKAYHELSEQVRAENDQKYLDYIKENILPIYGENTIIVDRGENWSPRYEMICKSSEFTPEPGIKPGCYSVMSEQKEVATHLYNFAESLTKQADDQDVVWYWSLVIEPDVMIIADKKWDKYLKWIEEEKNAD